MVNNVEKEERDIEMVLKNYEIYKNMKVREKIEYGMKKRKKKKEEIERRIEKEEKEMEIEKFMERKKRKI